jgi:hypothetical protein
MRMDDNSFDRLYEIFRKKMHEVYMKNYKKDAFYDSVPDAFNAWQMYLRESLSLEVPEAYPGEKPGIVKDENSKSWIRVMNPSNGTSYGHEFIVVPFELAEKMLALGEAPDSL